MMTNTQPLTIGGVRRALRQLDNRLTVVATEFGEYRITISDCEHSAYYASDLEDALGTGEAMALTAEGYRHKWLGGRWYCFVSPTGERYIDRPSAISALRASRSGSDGSDNASYAAIRINDRAMLDRLKR